MKAITLKQNGRFNSFKTYCRVTLKLPIYNWEKNKSKYPKHSQLHIQLDDNIGYYMEKHKVPFNKIPNEWKNVRVDIYCDGNPVCCDVYPDEKSQWGWNSVENSHIIAFNSLEDYKKFIKKKTLNIELFLGRINYAEIGLGYYEDLEDVLVIDENGDLRVAISPSEYNSEEVVFQIQYNKNDKIEVLSYKHIIEDDLHIPEFKQLNSNLMDLVCE